MADIADEFAKAVGMLKTDWITAASAGAFGKQQQQIALQMQNQQMNPQRTSSGLTNVEIIGGVAIIGLGAYLLLGKSGRRRTRIVYRRARRSLRRR